MSRETAAAALIDRVMRREGGVADVGDGMGVTRWGQTEAWLLTFGFGIPESREDAIGNYRAWLTRTGLIGLCAAPDALADLVIDGAVQHGHRTVIRWLQSALLIPTDGVWGPETQAAVDVCDRVAVAARIAAERVRLYGALISGNQAKNAKFAKGWLSRIAEQIEQVRA